MWDHVLPLLAEELKRGVLDLDVATPSSILAHAPGHIDAASEVIVGLKTDQSFCRAIIPAGGPSMVEVVAKAAGFEPDARVHEIFTKYRRTVHRRCERERPGSRHRQRPGTRGNPSCGRNRQPGHTIDFGCGSSLQDGRSQPDHPWPVEWPAYLRQAVSPEAAPQKGVVSPVAALGDILVAPVLEAGNMLAKQLSFPAGTGADATDVVAGARGPIILTSRADSACTASCAVAVLMARAATASGAPL